MILFLFSNLAYSQKQETTPPLELPNFIIEGKEQINIQAGIKQAPEKPAPLQKPELDSINSLQKQQSLLLPTKPLPDKILFYDYKRGYLKAEFGRYLTPLFELGYDFKMDEFDLFSSVSYEYSDGHIKNADYSKASVKLLADYVAPDKYWIFGGSKTEFLISFNTKNYNLYSIEESPQRSNYSFNASIHSDGKHEGYEFSTGAGLKTLQLIQDKSDAYDNAIYGYLTVRGLWSGFQAAGNASVDFHSFSGNGTHLIQLDASLKYFVDLFTVDASVGFQEVQNSNGIQRLNIFLNGNLDYRINKLFSVKANIKSAFNNNSFREMNFINPYIYSWANVDYDYEKSLKTFLYYHPDDKIALSGGIYIGSFDRIPYFVNKKNGTFSVNYAEAQKISLIMEGDWQITKSDNMVFNIIYNRLYNSSSGSGYENNIIPYTEPLKLSVIYRKQWIEIIGTQIGLFYISKRYADIENKVELDGYFNLNIFADYKLSKAFTAFVKLDNMFNSDIIIYEGYKERSMFISAGLMFQF